MSDEFGARDPRTASRERGSDEAPVSDNPESNHPDSGNPAYEPSAVNLRLDRLRSSALRVIRTRPRVPHPLFWSLLHSELKEIKRMKEEARAAREAWLSGKAEESSS